MSRRRRIVALVAALALVASLVAMVTDAPAACGGTEPTFTPATAAPAVVAHIDQEVCP